MAHVSPHQDAFKAIADANRRSMLDRMLVSECTVGELAAHLGIAQPSATQHIQVLRLAGLVDERVEGRRTYYSVRAAELRTVADWIGKYEAFWSDRLDALDRHLAKKRN